MTKLFEGGEVEWVCSNGARKAVGIVPYPGFPNWIYCYRLNSKTSLREKDSE